VASVRPWLVAGAAGCVALALAYLPPRGAKSSGRSVFFVQAPRATPARQRAQAVADEWRAVDASLQLLTSRRQLQERVRAASARGTSLIVVGESGSVVFAAPPIADSAAHLAWRQLGLGETKISVALVIQWTDWSPSADRPRPERGLAGYLAPDSTNRTTCVAAIAAGPYWTRVLVGDSRARFAFADLVQTLKAGLGPCAFYAAYGTPSAPVRSWLSARNWDPALRLDAGPHGLSNSMIGMADPRSAWYWDAIYLMPPTGVACLAGRAEGCRAAVLAGASADPITRSPDIVVTDRRWARIMGLVEEQRFLGEVARAVGRDRFLTFWTSPQPVDTTLALALKRPVGEWTADWQRDFIRGGPIRLGPAAPLGAVATAFGVALFAIAIVAVTASRRQVR
jgi:hypothetical protein